VHQWLLLPYQPHHGLGYAGKGCAPPSRWRASGSDPQRLLAIRIGQFFVIPPASAFRGLSAGLIWLFLRTRTGTAMTAVGSNPIYARASGISVDRMRTISVIISTLLGAIGIVVYQQSFGFIQLYNAPLFMPLSAVAAILIGGASINKASMLNVVVGAFLFQGLLTMTPSVINSALQTDMSETIRIIVSNGMILYALTRKTKAAS
jgi:simple sugar transport system permease protein